MVAAERPESFGMRSTQDMYKDFPAAVRSSYPLYVRTAGPQASLLLTRLPRSLMSHGGIWDASP